MTGIERKGVIVENLFNVLNEEALLSMSASQWMMMYFQVSTLGGDCMLRTLHMVPKTHSLTT